MVKSAVKLSCFLFIFLLFGFFAIAAEDVILDTIPADGSSTTAPSASSTSSPGSTDVVLDTTPESVSGSSEGGFLGAIADGWNKVMSGLSGGGSSLSRITNTPALNEQSLSKKAIQKALTTFDSTWDNNDAQYKPSSTRAVDKGLTSWVDSHQYVFTKAQLADITAQDMNLWEGNSIQDLLENNAAVANDDSLVGGIKELVAGKKVSAAVLDTTVPSWRLYLTKFLYGLIIGYILCVWIIWGKIEGISKRRKKVGKIEKFLNGDWSRKLWPWVFAFVFPLGSELVFIAWIALIIYILWLVVFIVSKGALLAPLSWLLLVGSFVLPYSFLTGGSILNFVVVAVLHALLVVIVLAVSNMSDKGSDDDLSAAEELGHDAAVGTAVAASQGKAIERLRKTLGG